jgi:hypothetical protein
MAGRREVVSQPPRHPEEAGCTREEEYPAPVQRRKNNCNQRRRDDGSCRRAGVHDTHGGGAFPHWKPFGDGFRGGGEASSFTHAEQETAYRQHAEPRRQTVAGASQRPPAHDQQESVARSEGVDQLAAAGVHQGVGGEECGLKLRELRVRDGNLALDGGDGDRQRLAVEVANRDRRSDQEGDAPAQRAKHGDRFFYTLSSSVTASGGTAVPGSSGGLRLCHSVARS